MAEKFKVTPWEVTGHVDYDRLIKDFGTKHLTDDLLKKLRSKSGVDHHMLRRKIFFSHRDLDLVFKDLEQGKPFALYTGRGPSGGTHLGHIIPWMFAKYLQDVFDVPIYFMITDDEKYLCKKDLTLEQTNKWGYENALDFLAVGFDPKKTHIFVDTDYAKTLYKLALPIAKRVTASSAKAVFGFNDSTNIGMYIWPALQSATCFLPSHLAGKPVRTLIPAAIDQDPYWRIARDVAPKLGLPKTAAIHCSFLPSLTGSEGKMSTSVGEHATIFLDDTPSQVKKKVNKYAFSGGRDTVEEHRKHGGNPDIDSCYQWLRFFEEDDDKLQTIHDDYKSGKLLSGELKAVLIEKINTFLAEHQKRKEKAKSYIDKCILRD